MQGFAAPPKQLPSENLELGRPRNSFNLPLRQASWFHGSLERVATRFQFDETQAYTDLIAARDFVGLSVREALPDIEGQGFYDMLIKVFQQLRPVSVNR